MCESHVSNIIKELIYQRIKIAVAIVAIKSKPENMSLQEHTTRFQKDYKQLFEKQEQKLQKKQTDKQKNNDCKSISQLEERIVSLEKQLQRALFSLLSNITAVPSDDTENPNEDSTSDNGSETSSRDSQDSNADTENSLEFIQAIVQLKCGLNTHSSLTLSQLRDILQSMPHIYFSLAESYHESALHVHSEDSGIGIASLQGSCSISSAAIKYVIRSTNINQQLQKCVQSVLTYIQKQISSTASQVLCPVVKQWKGSILEYAVTLIVELLDCMHGYNDCYQYYHNACINFIKKTIDGIKHCTMPDAYTVFENQCVVIAEMCSSLHLCTEVIEYVVDEIVMKSQNLEPLIEDLQSSDENSAIINDDLESNRQFYLFHILELLVKKFNKLNKETRKRFEKNVKKRKRPHPNRNVLEQWKISWHMETEIGEDEEIKGFIKKDQILKWKNKLEESAVISADISPYFTLYSWKCRSLLNCEDDIE